MPQNHQKVAAVCCRAVSSGDVMFLLVRSRGGNRWTFPKGTVEERDGGPHATVVREAFEEAGVVGVVHPEPLGSYRKAVPARKVVEQGDVEEVVDAYLFEFTGVRHMGEQGRRPTWFNSHHAARAFRSNPDDAVYIEQLCAILETARRRILEAAPAAAPANTTVG